MTSIPASHYVTVCPGVVTAGGTSLILNGLFLTSSYRVPTNTVQSFASPLAVSNFFGPTSNEYLAASVYFSGFQGCTKYPASILFAQWPGNTSAASFTGTISGTTLTVSAISDGALAVGQIISGSGLTAGTIITALGTGTGGFGTFDHNGYYDRESTNVTRNAPPSQTSIYTLDQWKATTGVGTTASVEPNGTRLYSKSFSTYSVSGATIVPNGNLATNAYDWQSYNGTQPAGQLTRIACAVGFCLQYVPGGSAGIVSSPSFSIVKGQWYRLAIDVAATSASQEIQLVVRRGGGGSNGYESLADRSLTFTAGTQFVRHSVIFQATKTVNYRDPLTGDWGARVDLQNLVSGKSVTLGNLELVPVDMDDTAAVSAALNNGNSAASNMACPFTGAQSSLCAKMMVMGTTTVVSWPLTVPGYSTTLLYAADPSLYDTDGDGIPDTEDRCAGTPAGSGVNAAGCAIGQ
jgi:hypothetical protein